MSSEQSEMAFGPIPVVKSKLERDFDEFIASHPRVWELFVRFTLQAIARGHRHLSSDLILARIRWETDVLTRGVGEIEGCRLKLNNNFTPYLSRKFHREHPEHDGFFRMRKVKGCA